VRRGVREYLPAIVLFAAAIGVWQAVSAFTGIKSYILPKPTSIVRTLARERSELLAEARVTASEVLIGSVVAVVVGFLIAVLLVHSKIFERAVYPLVIASQTIPILAIAPLLIVWFGFGSTSKILVVALFAFFPVVINTARGMVSPDRETFFLMRSFGASKFEVFRRVRFHSSMPYFFTGVKQAAVISVIGAVAGEWVGANRGLGPVMIAANSYLRTDIVFAAILILSLMAMAMFVLVVIVERVAIPWYYATREQRPQ
jgi:ABC-type nitrate/sulfonate/bicarbonate transport system permease component